MKNTFLSKFWKTSLVLPWVFFSFPANAEVNVVTYHNDNARRGFVQESTLTPGNVQAARFGKLFSQEVDGQVYGQPLYMPGVAIPGKGTHNVVYVVTQHDTVYAFDADNRRGRNKRPLWKARFARPGKGIVPVPARLTQCEDISPEIGITSTPVIDPDTNTLYVVAKTKEGNNILQRLHALDIATGQEKFGGPTTIEASVPGTGDGGTSITFDALFQHQRAGLLLANGVIYIAWASLCDVGSYHGWIMAYDAASLAQKAAFVTTPNGIQGGIWQGAAGLSVDDGGNLYFVSGNGTFDADTGGSDYGDSVVKLALNNDTFNVLDYFAPYNQGDISIVDLDLGSTGALLLPEQPEPHPHLLVTAGKEGTIYLLDRDNLGKFNPVDDSQIVQSLPRALGQASGVPEFGHPAFWNNKIYYIAASDVPKAFELNNGVLNTPIKGTFKYPDASGMPGGATPSISANESSDGILWAIRTDTTKKALPAILDAFDANDLTQLYSSEQKRARDRIGGAVKFSVPTVANGKVYVGSKSNLSVFGLR